MKRANFGQLRNFGHFRATSGQLRATSGTVSYGTKWDFTQAGHHVFQPDRVKESARRFARFLESAANRADKSELLTIAHCPRSALIRCARFSEPRPSGRRHANVVSPTGPTVGFNPWRQPGDLTLLPTPPETSPKIKARSPVRIVRITVTVPVRISVSIRRTRRRPANQLLLRGWRVIIRRLHVAESLLAVICR